MTGTERAALRLALGVLRGGGGGSRWAVRGARSIIGGHHFGADGAGSETYAGQPALADAIGAAIKTVPYRILRARLALYLRAVLRAERGERGLFWWASTDSREFDRKGRFTGPYVTRRIRVRDRHEPGAFRDYSPARPLWLDAPEHRGR